MKLCTLALAATALALPAWADDSHIRTVTYNPLVREEIINRIGRATNITYGPREFIVRVTFGRPGSWEGPEDKGDKGGSGVELKNNLPLWPRLVGRSNLIVVTEDDKGAQYSYQYVMVVRPEQDDDDPEATYGLIYRYPSREAVERTDRANAAAQAQRAVSAVRQAQAQTESARARLARDQAEAPRNWHYVGQGNVALAPVAVWDDGQRTFLRFQGQQVVPAVFTVGADGAELSVPHPAAQGDTIILPRIMAKIVLRLGGAVLAIHNKSYDPYGTDPGTGTGSVNVVRGLKRGS